MDKPPERRSLTARLRDFIERRKQAYLSDPLFHQNEVQANGMTLQVLLATAVIMGLVLALVRLDVLPLTDAFITPAILTGIIEIAILSLIAWRVKRDAWWLKYLLLFGLAIVFAWVDSLLTHKAAILMVIPVLCSSRYFSRRLTIWLTVTESVLFLLSALWGVGHGWLNLNDVTLPPGTVLTLEDRWIASGVLAQGLDIAQYARNTVLFSFLPKWLMFLLTALISSRIAHRGRELVLEEKASAARDARLETELNLAAAIQGNMLPGVFPPFPDRHEFDIFASMHPAREVGGDFYDFFFTDEDHLALVMADVSGKGIPAALLMMAAKIMLRNQARAVGSPAEILSAVNEQLSERNEANMFVTVWVGILCLSTGELAAANAGHEYPVLGSADGVYTMLKDRHGLPLGVQAGVAYRPYTLTLHPGETVFIYTDGVTEATAGEQLFGTQRMLDALNACGSTDPAVLLEAVKRQVDGFVQNAPQFDDMTMMCLRYHGKEGNQA